MIEKILIITEYPPNKRDYDRFGIEILRKNGFVIEIWDITRILHPEFSTHEFIPDSVDLRVRTFSAPKPVVQEIRTLDERCLGICFVEYGPCTWFLFRALSKHHVQYCVMQSISFPSPLDPAGAGRAGAGNLVRRILSLHPKEILRHLHKRLLIRHYSLFGISPATIVILTGKKSIGAGIYPIGKSTHLLWAHSFDYDLFLAENSQAPSHESHGGVFLDEYYPFHPDFLYLGMNSPFVPQDYYPKMCAFFTRLEKEWHEPISVAAHPRSNYEAHPDYFGGRQVRKGETIQMVRKCRFVIAHMSTALNFAILYNKPLVFVTLDKLQKLDSGKFIPGPYISTIATSLHCPVFNLDQQGPLVKDKALQVNPAAYAAYREEYIKKEGTPEIPLWEIVADFLKNTALHKRT